MDSTQQHMLVQILVYFFIHTCAKQSYFWWRLAALGRDAGAGGATVYARLTYVGIQFQGRILFPAALW